EAGQRTRISVCQMPHGTFDIARGDRRAGLCALIKRVQHGLAQKACLLVAIEDNDIAVNDSPKAELAFEKGEVGIELAKDIGELAVIVESDFDSVQGLAWLRLRATAPRLGPRTSAHRPPGWWCLDTGQKLS